MQKLVTIYLDVYGLPRESKGMGLIFSTKDLHGQVEEHLTEYLNDGWRVINLSSTTSAGTGAWVIATIEKTD